MNIHLQNYDPLSTYSSFQKVISIKRKIDGYYKSRFQLNNKLLEQISCLCK